MNCPKCKGKLELNESEGHIGFMCGSCKGIWLPTKYLSSLKHNHNYNHETLTNELQKNNPTSTNHICPSCSKALMTSNTNNVELEWCNSCGGIWFDESELSALVTKYGTPSTGEKVASNAADFLIFIGTLISN